MFSVRISHKSYGNTVLLDILGSNLDIAFMKSVQRIIDMSSCDEEINKLSYSDITPDNAVELAKTYGYTLTDVTEEYNSKLEK